MEKIVMGETLQRFASCEAGATSIEYTLIAGFIALGIVTATGSVGVSLGGIFGDIVSIFASL